MRGQARGDGPSGFPSPSAGRWPGVPRPSQNPVRGAVGTLGTDTGTAENPVEETPPCAKGAPLMALRDPLSSVEGRGYWGFTDPPP